MGFIKKNSNPTRIKTRYLKLQKCPNIYIYIYTYNLTLTNPSFLQSSIFSSSCPHSPQHPVRSTPHSPFPLFQLSPHSLISTVLSPISAVTPHASLSLMQSRLTQLQSDQLSLISTVTPTVCNSLSLFSNSLIYSVLFFFKFFLAFRVLGMCFLMA